MSGPPATMIDRYGFLLLPGAGLLPLAGALDALLAAALDHAGFRSAGHVTIDDGGAVLEADLGDLGRVRA